MRLFYRAMIVVLTAVLFSCAGGDVKQESGNGVFNKKIEYVNVDSDIETDFSKAVALLNQDQYQQATHLFY